MTEIHIYALHFVVLNSNPELTKLLYSLAAEYTQYQMQYDPIRRKQVWRPYKTFALCIGHEEEFRFHINQYPYVERAFRQQKVMMTGIKLFYHDADEGDYADIPIRENWVLKDYQEEASGFVMAKPAERGIPLIAMPMGKGKTVTSVVTASRLGRRLGVLVLARYIEKWQKDILAITELTKKEIITINGGKALVDASHGELTLKNGELPPVFIISLNTLSVWIKAYCESRDSRQLEEYGCTLPEFISKLGIGTMILDEAHQHLFAVYRAFCFMNVKHPMALTATMRHKDETTSNIQKMMFPSRDRFEKIKMDLYIGHIAASYQVMNFDNSRIETTERGSNRYSQTAFEESILKNYRIAGQYLDKILRLVDIAYIQKHKPGDKLIIFVGRASMAHAVCKAIKKKYPDYDTRPYLEPDPYENAMESDIRVTTILSAGTALDIPDLRAAINTNNVDSEQANLQALGRLRDLKDPERDVRYYTLYCTNIKKQVEYHFNRKELFDDGWVAYQKDLMLGTIQA